MTDGLFNPQDLYLESLTITTALGQPTDFSKMVVEINYFEDIYSNSITGNLILNDSSGMLNVLGFCGCEMLVLSFKKPGSSTRLKKVFRIFSVSDRKMVKDQNENYILNFCSEETMISEQTKVSKSYKNKKVSDIALDILNNELKVSADKAKIIEATKGNRDIIIPNLKPFEAINWLCTQAISNSPGCVGSSYLFYENFDGFNFKSLQSLFDGEVYKKYRYEPKNLTLPNDPRVQDMEKELVNVLAYETINNFDTINSQNSGAFANRMIAVDLLRQRYSVTDFDYLKYFGSAKKLNTSPVLSNYANRKGQKHNEAYESVLKNVTTNTGQSTFNPYIKEKQPDIKDINIETTVPNRTAQIPLMNTIRYKASVPGDPLLTVGKVVEFWLPELRTMPNGGRMWDIYYAGKFLVTAVRHKIDQENKFISIIEMSKESLYAPYYSFDNNSPAWKEIKGK